MSFESLSLGSPLLKALEAAGYSRPTAIQEKAIPKLLQGRDMVGCAQTGTGKTAAFALPTLQRLLKPAAEQTGSAKRRQRSGRRAIRALILAPTRELAGQISDSFATYGQFTSLRHAVIFGGVGQGPQVRALQSGLDILIATPGRLLDLIGQGHVSLSAVEVLILDEADQMLDMGFIHDLRKIIAHAPDRRQTLMFSATMPDAIRGLASEWLHRPFELKVAPVASTPDRVFQTVCFVDRPRKAAELRRLLQRTGGKTLVFSRTRRGADKIARCLQREGIDAVSLHGDKSQSKRTAVMRQFQSTRPPVLVATDLAARGLDFSDISHVINYDMPEAAETYVHRIGRTARAGASGQAISFCAPDERPRLRGIERLTGLSIRVLELPSAGDETRIIDGNRSDAGGGSQGPDAANTETPKHRVRPKSRARRQGTNSSTTNKTKNTSGAKRKSRQRAASRR